MSDGFGAQLLYRAATGFERAMADADAERLLGINAELTIENWDPYLVQTKNLPFLAYAMGVTLWEDDYWSEGQKREWVANQWLFKSLRGTVSGIRMALDASNYVLDQHVTPPQGFYASPDLTPAQWNAWIKQMPELRLTYAQRQGTRGLDEFFLDWGFADQDACSIDDGFALGGRYAVLRHLGADTPLAFVDYRPGFKDAEAVDYERLSTAGKSSLGLIVEEDYSDDDRYVCFEEVTPDLYTLRLDRSYSVDASEVTLTIVTPSQEPITPSYEINSDVGNGNGMVFTEDYSDDRYADQPDGGDKLLAQRIYLLDPAVAEPMTMGISFSDATRVGMPSYTAELMVDLFTSEPLPVQFIEETEVGEGFAIDEDPTHIDRALRAINAGKALRDTALVTFAVKRPVAMGDYLADTTAATDWVADIL
ncbi:phage tail protein I [Bradyrhizobium sp. Leo121]|uniref:phage tail protein I n=1 Tax=Bradyrhizobium sp. Leo121 TaxID=1571195 RepID=UPI00102A3158|nr:phage tail protein I [Bradyrhizobium sp. Leo121]RZN24769.1 phage tail protein I [Bradyrhizobium sp. Leo121]